VSAKQHCQDLLDELAEVRAQRDELLEALSSLVQDERKFIHAYRTAVDDYVVYCNFCGATGFDERNLAHWDIMGHYCPITLSRAAIARGKGEG
jgi:hypothetical protein